MQIEMLEVGKVQKEKKYFILPIKYKDLGNGKEFDRKVYSFNADAYKALKDASAGENYSIDLKKDDNGYWQWENITKVDATTKPATKGSGTVGTVRNTYETPEERAKRQQSIARQWGVNAAIEFMKLISNTNASVDEVLTLAMRFENHVNRVSSLDLTDDKPWETTNGNEE